MTYRHRRYRNVTAHRSYGPIRRGHWYTMVNQGTIRGIPVVVVLGGKYGWVIPKRVFKPKGNR